jgi:hypothetical protein
MTKQSRVRTSLRTRKGEAGSNPAVAVIARSVTTKQSSFLISISFFSGLAAPNSASLRLLHRFAVRNYGLLHPDWLAMTGLFFGSTQFIFEKPASFQYYINL